MTDPLKTTILPARNPELPPDTPWYAVIFITKVSEAWKFLSVNVPIIAAAAIEADQASGGQLVQLVPATWRPHLAALALVGAALLRLVNQSKGTTP